MRALYYGGAFNPPTAAHIGLADYVRKKLGYEKVIFMPSKRHYIEGDEGKDYAFSDEERYAMLQKIAANHPWMIVSDLEIRQAEQPRTYNTLCKLREQGYELKLLIGSDWLSGLEHVWLHVPEIVSEFGIAVMARADDAVEEMISSDPYLSALRSGLTVVETPDTWKNASASKVRAKMMEIRRLQDELKDMVPEELCGMKDYI